MQHSPCAGRRSSSWVTHVIRVRILGSKYDCHPPHFTGRKDETGSNSVKAVQPSFEVWPPNHSLLCPISRSGEQSGPMLLWSVPWN